MNKPLISIIMPAFNSEKFINESIQSIINQTYINWELIIIDDCSNDRTKEILRELMNYEERIYLFSNKINKGVAESRNIGINNSRGEYITFLDSDDKWDSRKLELQLNFMKNNNYYFSFTGYCNFYDDNRYKYIKYRKKSITYKNLLKGNVIGCLTVMLSTNSIKNLEMSRFNHEDYATWLKLLRIYGDAYYLDECLAYHRIHPNSLSYNKFRTIKWMWKIYRNQENLNILKSTYFTCFYIIKALIKHLGIYKGK